MPAPLYVEEFQAVFIPNGDRFTVESVKLTKLMDTMFKTFERLIYLVARKCKNLPLNESLSHCRYGFVKGIIAYGSNKVYDRHIYLYTHLESYMRSYVQKGYRSDRTIKIPDNEVANLERAFKALSKEEILRTSDDIVAINKVSDFINVANTHSLDAPTNEDGSSLMDAVPCITENALVELIASERVKTLTAIMDECLNPLEKHCLQEYYGMGTLVKENGREIGYRDIANDLVNHPHLRAISHTTVKTTIEKAIKKMSEGYLDYSPVMLRAKRLDTPIDMNKLKC